MSLHLSGMSAAEADRPNAPVSQRESEAVALAVDLAPRSEALLALVQAAVRQESQDVEIDIAGERNAMPLLIVRIPVRVERQIVSQCRLHGQCAGAGQ